MCNTDTLPTPALAQRPSGLNTDAMFARLAVLCGLTGRVAAFGSLCDAGSASKSTIHHTKIRAPIQEFPDPNMKVAFYGDTGHGEYPSSGNLAVMRMAKEWGAEFVIHGGDFDYVDSPSLWASEVESVFGPEFPYFINVGNHDTRNWRGTESEPVGYADWGEHRLETSNTAQYCAAADGDYGVKQVCSYKGLTFIMSGVGTMGNDHPNYIRQALRDNPTAWRKCNWHKNQRLMQVGGKNDEVGWEVYEVCREEGAFIVNNHEHSFSRTKNMARFSEEPLVANEDPVLTVEPGQVWLSVVGLGGRSIRPAQNGLENNVWWANSSYSQVGAQYGAQLCTFHIDGDPRKAHCEFRDIDGRVWDEFIMYTRNDVSVEHPKSKPVHTSVDAHKVVELVVNQPEDDFAFSVANRTTSFDVLLSDVDAGDKFINVSAERSAGFVFTTANGAADATNLTAVRQAHLQIYGAQPDGIGLANYTIRGVISHGRNGAIVTTAAAVRWDKDDEMGEAEEAWVSPDLSAILRELLAVRGSQTLHASGRGETMVELLLEGEEGTPPRWFHASDFGKCWTPTLWLELSKA